MWCLSSNSIFVWLVKIEFMSQYQTDPQHPGWSLEHLAVIFGFLNQVAGIRIIRKIKSESVQHFVFSGHDAILTTHELILLDKWWNVTILSAVSNLHLNAFDCMVFWYNLDQTKIELLLKHHMHDHDGKTLIQMMEDGGHLLAEYDQKINSGKLYDLTEVVRDLNKKTDIIAEQSYSERQLFEKAYERLKSEFEIVIGDKAKLKIDKALKRDSTPETIIEK
jgi:hypothetical protein